MFRRRPAPLLLACLAFVATCVLPAAAQAASGPLKGEGSALCLDVVGGSTAPATSVDTWTCLGTQSNQQWELTAAQELRVFGGTRCLDAYDARTAPGTPLISFPCTGGANQKWRYRADHTLVGVQSGLCVDVAYGQTWPGGTIQLWTCTAGPNQRWSQPFGVGSDTTAPTAPGAPKMTAILCRSGTLSWAASSDAVGVAFYDIYHDGQLMKTVSGTTLSTSLTLAPGAIWGFYVNARDAAGNVSQASPTTTVVIPQCSADTQAPTVPTGLTGTATGTSATLKWTASTDNVAVTAYDIYRDAVKVGSTAGTTFTDNGLTANTTYSYSVLARDAQANASARSTAVSVRTASGCTTPVCSVSQVATDTDLPWGLVELPGGTALYTRRDTHDVIRLNLATGAKTNLGVVPNVQGTDGEGGLLGIAVTSGFPATDPWIYLHHTSPTDNRIVRIKLNASGSALDTASEQVLLTGIPRNKFHNGGRLRFGPDGKLYATAGDALNGAYAQDLNNLAGKVLRLNPDGSVPADNPYGNYVWSYGHRNPQGLAFDAQGRLWEQEFGNTVYDETNLITKGGNYGWPDCEGTLTQSGTGCATPGYVAPKAIYPVAQGSCSGIAIVREALYVACQRGTRMYRHEISGASLVNQTEFFSGTYGRIRTVEPTRDGNILIATTNNDGNEKILKVVLGR